MQIDAVRFKLLTEQEKTCLCKEGLCLYCEEPKHIVQHCPKKQHNYKMRSTTVKDGTMSENGFI